MEIYDLQVISWMLKTVFTDSVPISLALLSLETFLKDAFSGFEAVMGRSRVIRVRCPITPSLSHNLKTIAFSKKVNRGSNVWFLACLLPLICSMHG